MIQWVVVQPYRRSTERWGCTGIIIKGFAGGIKSSPPETGEKKKKSLKKKKKQTLMATVPS